MYHPWTPRSDWDEGEREHYDVEDLFDITVFGHDAQVTAGYPGYGPSVPPGYPHGPYAEPDMGAQPYQSGQPYGAQGAYGPGHMHRNPHHHQHHHPQQLANQPQSDELSCEP
jgi:hypothetical protein